MHDMAHSAPVFRDICLFWILLRIQCGQALPPQVCCDKCLESIDLQLQLLQVLLASAAVHTACRQMPAHVRLRTHLLTVMQGVGKACFV
jgi:hypothetical protein